MTTDAHDWERIISTAVEREDWFSAFTNSVTYFEHWGYWRLMWHCIKSEVDLDKKTKDKMKNLSISNLALFLYLLKSIDRGTYMMMNKIISERNRLVHPGRKGLSYRDRKEKERAIQLLTDAKTCIGKLQENVGRA